MSDFCVRIAGDDLTFSAAHFLTFGDQRESLHGHNYRVAAEVSAPLGEDQLVLDFVALAELLKAILRELDHAVLVPAEHPSLRCSAGPEGVELTHAGDRWLFPRSDCRLLPLAATTAELLAEYIGRQLRDQIPSLTGRRPERVRIELEEMPGRTAVCELSCSPSGATRRPPHHTGPKRQRSSRRTKS